MTGSTSGRSLSGYNPDSVWIIVPALPGQLSTQCVDYYPLNEWTIHVPMEAGAYEDKAKGLTLLTQLSWSHFLDLIYIDETLKRNF